MGIDATTPSIHARAAYTDRDADAKGADTMPSLEKAKQSILLSKGSIVRSLTPGSLTSGTCYLTSLVLGPLTVRTVASNPIALGLTAALALAPPVASSHGEEKEAALNLGRDISRCALTTASLTVAVFAAFIRKE